MFFEGAYDATFLQRRTTKAGDLEGYPGPVGAWELEARRRVADDAQGAVHETDTLAAAIVSGTQMSQRPRPCVSSKFDLTESLETP